MIRSNYFSFRQYHLEKMLIRTKYVLDTKNLTGKFQPDYTINCGTNY